ncbi:MAG TPA: cyclodeaminase/cyclohydrolase family protein [candidate division Zixibacteria bacterium]|nr:cyclodeaminase/cyclohydrolase family protein [candidate division Zixibacteria bacterium]
MEEATTSLTQLPVSELLARLATRDPVPGGGSAAALAGATGAALVSMVVELTSGRPEAADREERLRDIGRESAERRATLERLAEEDADAYRAVIEARRLPRSTDEEKAARQTALNTATRRATEVPLRTAQAAARVVELAREIAVIGNRHAVSDAGVAALLAAAAVRGAALNVRINLPYLPVGEPLAERARAELERLEPLALVGERAVMGIVQRRLNGA